MVGAGLRLAGGAMLAPLLVLAVLAGVGDLPASRALLAAGLIAAGALALTLVWTRDLRGLASQLQAAKAGEAGTRRSGLMLPETISRDAMQLGQLLGDRSVEVDRLRRAEESILERLPDPLIVLGPDRAVRRANEAARLAFGTELAAVLRHPDLRGAIDRAMASGEKRPHSAEVSVPVPVPREVQATVVKLNAPLAGGRGALVVLSDRTRERAVERMRADFVANASHELRTPLASLIGFIDTLRGPAADDPPAQARFLDIMAEQAGRMNRLIDDLLSLSRIELTEHQMPAEAVSLADLVTRMLASFEIRLKERRITLDLWMAPDVPAVVGDPDQLEQVLQNLFDNAVKYGREGGLIRVALEVVAAGGKYPARHGVVLSVADDGAGISREHLPRLTERFYRVDTGRSRAIGGTGLGLAIVKHVVNRHRGVLLIESEEGRGTSFSVWLPIS
jgi:two-component system phosphate regulon sensor histidine kinase PhoR